jgi:hypothetical protein
MIQHILARKFDHRAVSLGWFDGCDMVICPSFKKMIEFNSEHRIIVIVRVPDESGSPRKDRDRKGSVEFDPSQYVDASVAL